MKFIKFVSKGTFLLVILFLISCASSSKSGLNKVGLLEEKDKTAFTFSFYEGERHKMLGNFSEAAGFFLKCIELNPESAASYYELANLHVYQRDYAGAYNYAKKAVDLAPENIWYKKLLAALYISERNYSDAVKIYEEIIKDNPDDIDLMFDLAALYSGSRKLNKAVDTYAEIEGRIGYTEEVGFGLKDSYLENKKSEKAEQELQKLISVYPDNPQYKIELGSVKLSEGKVEQAKSIYLKLINEYGCNSIASFSLAEIFLKEKNIKQSFDFVIQGVECNNSMPSLIATFIVDYLSVLDSDENFDIYFKKIIESFDEKNPNHHLTYSLLADFYLDKNQKDSAVLNLRKLVEVNPQNYPAWEQLLVSESELKNWKEMLEGSEKAIEYFPNQPLLFLFGGIASMELKDYKKSNNLFSMGSDLVIDNDQMLFQFYSYLAEVNHASMDHQESDMYFEKCLKIDPENIHILNNYAYYLSQRDDDLDKALEMSKKTIEKEPESFTFLDTYAWILYKQENYSEALKYIEKAIDNGAEARAVILEHYGDILWKLNRTDEAKMQFQKAIEAGGKEEGLKKKIEKIAGE